MASTLILLAKTFTTSDITTTDIPHSCCTISIHCRENIVINKGYFNTEFEQATATTKTAVNGDTAAKLMGL